MLGLAFSFLPGVALGLRYAVDPLAPLVISLLFLLAAVVRRRGGVSVAALFAAWLFAAWAVTSMAQLSPSGRSLEHLVDPAGEYMDVIGVVRSEPSVSDDGGTQWLFLKTEGIRRVGSWQRARGTLRTRWRSAQPLQYGDRVLCSGLMIAQDERYASGSVSMNLYVDEAELRVLDSGRGNPLVAWCLRGRERCAEILSRGIEKYPRHSGLLMALLLGYRQSLPRELREAFATTGTLHIFAISGLHVGVMAVLIILVLKTCGLSREHWVLVLFPLLVIYTLGTGMKVSAVRACVMAVVFWSAGLFRRRPDGPSSLALAAILILFFSPHQLVDPGFILSFVVVSGIMLLYPRFGRVFGRPFRRDPWKIENDPFWIRWPRTMARYLSDVAAVSLAAWLVSAPLTAVYFNVFSPAALLGNILVVPGSFLVVFTGCLSLIAGSSFSLLAEIFNHANRVFISMLLAVVDGVRCIPGGHAYVRPPSGVIIALWYGILLSVIALRGKARMVVMTSLALIAMVAVWRMSDDRDIRVDVFDVWQGGAAFVDLPGEEDMLVDAGPAYSSSRLVRHLRSRGVDRLKVLVLTHPDIHHIGGAMDVVSSMPVGEVWCSPFNGRSAAFVELMKEVRRRDIPVRRLRAGDAGPLAGGAVWKIFHPENAGQHTRADDASLVLRVGRDDVAVLFMGGAGGNVERRIASRALEPSATVLIPGIQKRAAFCTEPWVDLVDPDLVLLGRPAFSHNRASERDLKQRLAGRDVGVWDIGLSGPVRVEWGRRNRQQTEPFRLIPLER